MNIILLHTYFNYLIYFCHSIRYVIKCECYKKQSQKAKTVIKFTKDQQLILIYIYIYIELITYNY